MRVSRHDDLAASVVDAIGGTPAVELARLTRGLPGRIVAKLEYLNPGFSKKDRIAREILDEAAASGELVPGQPVVELTSGNTGTGLAIVCAVRGHPFVAVMSEGNSRERARMMRALGAEVVLVPQAAGLAAGPGERRGPGPRRGAGPSADAASWAAFRADQFTLPGARLAHERHTGPELWAQAGGQIDAFCEFVGSGGTYAGITTALKARRPTIACYVVEPEGAAVLAGRAVVDPNHRIQGGGYAMRELAMLAGVPVDGYIAVGDDRGDGGHPAARPRGGHLRRVLVRGRRRRGAPAAAGPVRGRHRRGRPRRFRAQVPQHGPLAGRRSPAVGLSWRAGGSAPAARPRRPG